MEMLRCMLGYNKYNILAAELTAEVLEIVPNIKNFKPAFGRSEQGQGRS